MQAVRRRTHTGRPPGQRRLHRPPGSRPRPEAPRPADRASASQEADPIPDHPPGHQATEQETGGSPLVILVIACTTP